MSSRNRVAPVRGWLWCCALALCLAGCAGQTTVPVADPLPSWQEGAAKAGIIDFVRRVTDRESPDFVAEPARVAVFDHDGTLIVERPTLVQFEFVYHRVRELAPAHPEWAGIQPFRSVLEDDRAGLAAMGYRRRAALIDAGQGNLFQSDFEEAAAQFLATARHTRFDARYTDLTYTPMIELLRYLAAHDFRVYIVSGGGIDFIRTMSAGNYALPRERVIGSSTKSALRERDGRVAVYRKTGFRSLNAGPFKPLNIWLHVGRRPILAVGNSDGDLDMLRFTALGQQPSLAVLLQHDDAVREYAYADDSVRIREAAERYGWLSVSMRDDFRRVFGVVAD